MKVQVKRRARKLVGAMCLMVAASAGLASAQALEQLPAETLVVVRVKNVGQFSQKVAGLSKKLGFDQMSPDAADPMKKMQEEAGIKEGLNKDGDMAFAFIDPAVTGVEESFVMLIPVSDYKAFLGNFGDAKEESDGIASFTMKNGEPHFSKSLGKYAVLSPSKEALAFKPAGVKAESPLSKKEITDKDFVVFANFAALRAKFLPEIEKNREFWLSELEKDVMSTSSRHVANEPADPNDPGAGDAAAAAQKEKARKFMPVIKAAANQGINVIQAVLKDGQGATFGFNIEDAGINATMVMEFAPSSYAGKLIAMFKGSDATYLAGLPEGKYLAYGGASYDSKPIVKAIDDFSAPIMAELAKVDDPAAPTLTKFVGTLKKAVGAMNGQTFGAMAPTGALGQEAIAQSINISRGDAKTIEAAQQEILKGQEEIMSLAGGAAGPQTKTTFTPNARQIDGVTFNQFKTEFAGDMNSPEAMQAQQFLGMLYGPDGMGGLTAQLNDKEVLTVSGLSAANLSNAIKAAKAGEDILGKTDAVKTTAAQLPQNRSAVMYIALDNVIGMGLNYARAFGMPINVQMAENLPPIGIASSADGSAYRVDGHVPTPLMESVSSAVLQVYMGMMGGRQGGGAPGAPQGGGL